MLNSRPWTPREANPQIFQAPTPGGKQTQTKRKALTLQVCNVLVFWALLRGVGILLYVIVKVQELDANQ